MVLFSFDCCWSARIETTLFDQNPDYTSQNAGHKNIFLWKWRGDILQTFDKIWWASHNLLLWNHLRNKSGELIVYRTVKYYRLWFQFSLAIYTLKGSGHYPCTSIQYIRSILDFKLSVTINLLGGNLASQTFIAGDNFNYPWPDDQNVCGQPNVLCNNAGNITEM